MKFLIFCRWHDVKTIVFDDGDVTLAGQNFVHNFEEIWFEKKKGNNENTVNRRS